MNNASALGFYAKHPLIMDELYDLSDDGDLHSSIDAAEGVPHELVAIAKANADILSKLIVRVDEELEPFQTMYETLRVLVNSDARKQGWQWDHSVKVNSKDGRMKYSKTIEFGWIWETQNDVMYLYPWAWMSGGRVAERYLFSQIKELAPKIKDRIRSSIEIEDRKWASGLVRLDKINGSQRVGADFSLDIEKLTADVWESFAWINKSALSQLFKGSCEL